VQPVQLALILDDATTVYRAYARKLDEDGRVQYRDFMLRDSEAGLSVALTGEKALDELDVRGYVPLTVGDVRKLGLDVVPKVGEPDAELLEIIGIRREDSEGIGTSLAANAGVPIAAPEHQQRIKSSRRRGG
jgi:hypothetical protein